MQENKMGVMPVGKLLFSMSWPMILSMLVQALYNIVDSVFVAMQSENALTAVSLAFPIQNIMLSLGIGTGVGVNALVSRYLGAKNQDKANNIATHGVILAAITSVVFVIISAIIINPFYSALTDDPEIFGYGVMYTRIVCFLCVGVMFQTMLEKILQSTGRTFLSMCAMLTGAIINLIFDPIFIFGLLGFPALGVAGAALATVLGQICAACVALYCCFKKNPEVKINLKKYRLQGKTVADIYKIAVPSIILSSVGSIMTFGLNKILMGFSSTAAAVFGAYFKLQSFIFMPVFGLNNGLIPIIAYNYGARRPDRIKNTMKYAYVTAIGIMFVGMVIFMTAPGSLLALFSASDNMLAMGIPALRIISTHFCIAGFCIVTGALFQAMGFAIYSMINSIMRQLLVLLPAAYILAKIGGLAVVWWSFPIAELMSATVTTFFLIRIYRRIIKPLSEGKEVEI